MSKTSASAAVIQVPVIVAKGGTGAATLTGLVKGNGTSPMTAVAAPSGAVVGDSDAQTLTNKILSDEFMGDVWDNQSAMKESVTLMASTDFLAIASVDIGSSTLEVPSTGSLEISSYTENSSTTGSALVPTGVIQMFGSSIIPPGWLLCDGSTVFRATYPNLYSVIGTTYGGTGLTSFNLPNFVGRSPLGSGGPGSASGATSFTLGSQPTTGAGGEQTHTMTTGELVAHTHNGPATSDGNMVGGGAGGAGANITQGGGAYRVYSAPTTGSTGSSTAFNILHPVSVVNFIIKT